MSQGGHGGAHGHDENPASGGAAAAAFEPVEFRLNGQVDLVTPSAAGTYTGSGIFDAQPVVDRDVYLDSVALYQRVDGASGTTTVEVYYYDIVGLAWVIVPLFGTLTLAAGGGNDAGDQASANPTPTLYLAGTRFGAMLTTVQGSDATDIPTDIVVSFIFSAPP